MGLTPFSACPGGDWLWIPVSESFISFFFFLFKQIQKNIARKNKSIMCVFTNVCPLYIGLHMVYSLVYSIVCKEPYHAGMS
jgi:hypothetical protein